MKLLAPLYKVRTAAMESEPPAADDLPLTGKVAATEVADGKREKATNYTASPLCKSIIFSLPQSFVFT